MGWGDIGGSVYYCSHHQISREMIKRLKCTDKHCEYKWDTKTGDWYEYTRLYLDNGKEPMGYLHIHE